MVKVLGIRLYKKKTEKTFKGYFRGYANIELTISEGMSLEIRGIEIYSDGRGGYSAIMPRYKEGKQYFDFIYPSAFLLMSISNAVKEAYKEETKPYVSPI